MKQLMTLGFIKTDDQILLAMKKRGFGEGRWNGYGGKVSEGEIIEESFHREVKEESNIETTNVEKLGLLNFSFVDSSKVLEVHIYNILEYFGKPVETEEMKPKWFNLDAIPYNQIWSDDRHWLPLFIDNKKFIGSFHFDKPADKSHAAEIISYNLNEVKKLS
jgi:8-oxo-dGTP diphosphatase/2-hydroxy-dATP diphosphatase